MFLEAKHDICHALMDKKNSHPTQIVKVH